MAPSDPAPQPTRRHAALAMLLLAGVGLVALTQSWPPSRADEVQYAAATVLAAVGLCGPVRRRLGRVLDRWRNPSARTVRLITAVLALASSQYFVFSGLRQGRDFLPKFHDEFMYLLQARFLTQGRLWLPQHPLAQFFETFHVLVRPVYAPIYFPGTALLYALPLAAHVEPMMVSALVCGAVVGLLYRVVAELTDGVGGLLAALLAMGLPYLHFLSLMVMSHSVLLLLALAMIWAFLHWRRRPSWGWALLIGVFAGWAAVTRPLDALCYALPVGLAMMMATTGPGTARLLRTTKEPGRPRPGLPGSVRPRILLALFLGAAPFLCLQLVMDRGITGRYLDNPASYYDRTYWPQVSLGFGEPDPNWSPPTPLAQFHDFYRQFMFPDIRAHARDSLVTMVAKRWPVFCTAALPCTLTLLFVPAALLVLGASCRWVVGAMVPLYLIIYAFFPFFLGHYPIVAAPGMILAVVAGAQAVGDAWPRVAVSGTLALAAAGLTCLTELNPFLHDPPFESQTLADVSLKLANLPHTPAVVLFRYTSGNDQAYHEEPVYNIDTAWPDDAAVIRAHDLGPQEDQKIFRYYARLQPQRYFYLYDRKTRTLTELGPATQLAH